jgi:hypothetical protein
MLLVNVLRALLSLSRLIIITRDAFLIIVIILIDDIRLGDIAVTATLLANVGDDFSNRSDIRFRNLLRERLKSA